MKKKKEIGKNLLLIIFIDFSREFEGIGTRNVRISRNGRQHR